MKFIRSIYFWMFLGSIAFIGFSYWSSSIRMSRKDMDEIRAEREAEGKDPEPMSPFGIGFTTACLVGGFWLMVYLKEHPGPRGKVGVVVIESNSKRPILVGGEVRIEADDPAYDGVIHIAPDTEEWPVGSLGIHDFTLECPSRPDVRQVHGRTLILHHDWKI